MAVATLFVQPKDLHQVWPFVRAGLDAIARRVKPDRLIEDVYATLRAGTSFLTLGLCNGVPVGFAVSYFNDLPFSGQRELFVWCTWTLPLRERQPGWDVDGAIRQVLAELIALARQQGAKHLACISPRKAFARWAGDLGFSLLHSTYRLQI